MTWWSRLSGASPDSLRIDGFYRRNFPRGLTSARAAPVRPRGNFRLSKVKSVGVEIAERFATAIDVEEIKVRQFDGFVFLCGGAIESTDAAIASARHYALGRRDEQGKIAGHRVFIAERMTSLLQGDDFHDLLEFEEHIAALCACVLIFVESPGSIAELGSFSVMKHLAPRLLVVCEQRFESNVAPSFIFLGPIASLRRRRSESVQVFPIGTDVNGAMRASGELLSDCWEYIEEAMLAILKRPIPESPLVKSELPHQMVLVAELIDLGIATKFGEIEQVLDAFGVVLRGKSLRRILRILEQFDLVVSKTYGNDRFYYSSHARSLVSFKASTVSGAQVFDPVRFKARLLEYYETEDQRRSKAIRAFLRTPTE